jgi:hypothetical protein
MAAVAAAPGTDALLRRAARIALRVRGELDVVHVAVSDATLPGDTFICGTNGGAASRTGASRAGLEVTAPRVLIEIPL